MRSVCIALHIDRRRLEWVTMLHGVAACIQACPACIHAEELMSMQGELTLPGRKQDLHGDENPSPRKYVGISVLSNLLTVL